MHWLFEKRVYETKKKYNKITRVIKRNGKSRIKKY